MYAFFSMALAMGSFVIPNNLTLKQGLSLSSVLLSFAIGFLLVGSSLFLPFAYLIYTFKTAIELRDRFHSMLNGDLPIDIVQMNEQIQKAKVKHDNTEAHES